MEVYDQIIAVTVIGPRRPFYSNISQISAKMLKF